ncbi:MAG TPA: family 43 glycosylhydrolase [Acidimicrobiales bacterium]|nr:family 43 glycosylhydrolase [Acidimicrobiales bacterium]
MTPGANRPDPFVLVTAKGDYLYTSQTGFSTPPVSVSFSRSPGHWPAPSAAMLVVPPWAEDGFTWGPDVRFIDGRYVLYFDAWASTSLYFDAKAQGFSARAQCIGAAVSAEPGGVFRPESKPMVCQFNHHGAIDPRSFLTPDGTLWLDWKSDDNASAPGPYPPTHLFAQRLSRNGLALFGQRFQLLEANQTWQDDIVEAPDMVFAKGAYWLFYSERWFDQPAYAIGVARCASPSGPCVARPKPWFGSNPQGAGPGEGSLFQDSLGRWWMVYSAWFDGYLGREDRPVALARVGFGPAGPYLARF